METFNSKLLEKYNNLKKRKFSEEDWGRKRDSEIQEYQAALEDLFEELKNRNESLFTELSTLQVQHDKRGELLIHESKKAKELQREIVELKRMIAEMKSIEDKTPTPSNKNDQVQVKERAIECSDLANTDQDLPSCYIRKFDKSDYGPDKDCIFRMLFEFLTGMQFSINHQKERFFLSASHGLSGYSFDLSFVQTETGEWELMYHPITLGTLEKIATEWMKYDIIFSLAMSSLFFQRISHVISHR